MLPTTFPEYNAVLGKPKDWKDEECMDLPVWVGHVPMGEGKMVPHFISCWKPSKEDIDAIVAGSPIYVYVSGEAMPPMSLQTENPFKYGEESEV